VLQPTRQRCIFSSDSAPASSRETFSSHSTRTWNMNLPERPQRPLLARAPGEQESGQGGRASVRNQVRARWNERWQGERRETKTAAPDRILGNPGPERVRHLGPSVTKERSQSSSIQQTSDCCGKGRCRAFSTTSCGRCVSWASVTLLSMTGS
jgi:hypothetical protein